MKKYFALLVLPVLLAGASGALLAGGRFTPHALAPLLAATLNACIGIFVFLHDPRQKVNRAFALVNLVLAFGSLLQFGLYVAPDAAFALRWARILGPAYFLIPTSSLHFGAVYTKNQSRLVRWMVLLGLVYAAVFSFLALLPDFAITYERTAHKYVPRADALYGASMAVLLLFCGLGILLVIASYIRLGPGVRKNQFKVFLAASLIALGMGSIDYLKSFGFPAFPVSSFAMAAFGLLNAYAIVRHRFLDIEVIVKKGAVYTTLTAVITLSYAGMMMMANMLFEGTSQSLAVNAVAVIIIAFAFQPLRNGIQILVDRWFYRSRYNYRQTLRAFGAEIIRTVGRRETALRLVHTVTETVHIGHACIAWKEKGESGYRILAERAMGGEAVFFEAGRPLEAPGIFDDAFRKGAEVLDREELGLLAQDAPSTQEKESLLSAASWLKTLGYELVIPVLVKDDMTALFLLSAKLSEAAYTAQDVELLQICANQAGVAIESSVLYDRLERSRRLAVLGEMASGVAHEIKNPLQSIKIFVESLDDNFHDPVFRENFASVVLPQIDGLDRMVRDLLEYARPPRLLKVEADVLDLVRITLRLLEGDILNLGVTVRFDKTSNPVLVSCDGEKIKRVLLNVIQNALDAVKDCEPKEVEISAALGDGWAVVEVVDSGVGIPEENIKKLFRPFFTTKEEGTGLGLALAQKTVEDHNGSMSVSSAHGLGTKVTIRLPALGGAE